MKANIKRLKTSMLLLILEHGTEDFLFDIMIETTSEYLNFRRYIREKINAPTYAQIWFIRGCTYPKLEYVSKTYLYNHRKRMIHYVQIKLGEKWFINHIRNL